jgi:hypothetical protein
MQDGNPRGLSRPEGDRPLSPGLVFSPRLGGRDYRNRVGSVLIDSASKAVIP